MIFFQHAEILMMHDFCGVWGHQVEGAQDFARGCGSAKRSLVWRGRRLQRYGTTPLF
jgi:hypothetical protein